MVGLGRQRQRVHHHEPGQVGPHARRNVPDAELGERVVPPVGQDDVVRRLPAPVEPDDRVDRTGSAQSQSTTVPLPASP